VAQVQSKGAATTTKWTIKGDYFEACGCLPGCSCNFNGFPSSKDGGCHAVVAFRINEGRCGAVDLSGLSVAAVLDWPKAIHEGNGKAVAVIPASASDAQVDAISKILTGQYGGMPWEILATTYQVAGLERKDVVFEGKGLKTKVTIPGIGEAVADSLKNPVTGEENIVDVTLGKGLKGMIWSQAEFGQATFHFKTGPIDLNYKDTHMAAAKVDWKN
jgi:hypothetical protein